MIILKDYCAQHNNCNSNKFEWIPLKYLYHNTKFNNAVEILKDGIILPKEIDDKYIYEILDKPINGIWLSPNNYGSFKGSEYGNYCFVIDFDVIRLKNNLYWAQNVNINYSKNLNFRYLLSNIDYKTKEEKLDTAIWYDSDYKYRVVTDGEGIQILLDNLSIQIDERIKFKIDKSVEGNQSVILSNTIKKDFLNRDYASARIICAILKENINILYKNKSIIEPNDLNFMVYYLCYILNFILSQIKEDTEGINSSDFIRKFLISFSDSSDLSEFYMENLTVINKKEIFLKLSDIIHCHFKVDKKTYNEIQNTIMEWIEAIK